MEKFKNAMKIDISEELKLINKCSSIIGVCTGILATIASIIQMGVLPAWYIAALILSVNMIVAKALALAVMIITLALSKINATQTIYASQKENIKQNEKTIEREQTKQNEIKKQKENLNKKSKEKAIKNLLLKAPIKIKENLNTLKTQITPKTPALKYSNLAHFNTSTIFKPNYYTPIIPKSPTISNNSFEKTL